jgi:phage tail protein X
MADTLYRTIEGDAWDLICYRQYGISSQVTEFFLDYNYRIADYPIVVPSGVVVALPPQTPPSERSVVHLWD